MSNEAHGYEYNGQIYPASDLQLSRESQRQK